VTRAQHCCRLAGLVLVVTLAACSSPNPALYTIAPVAGPEQSAGPKVVLIQQISVERYLERLQIVRSSESFRLDVVSNSASACLRVSCSARAARCRRSPTQQSH
jgi:uncharacterized lipoprotein YmbA